MSCEWEGDTAVTLLVSNRFIHFNNLFLEIIHGESQRMASLPPIDVHLCICVCETLAFCGEGTM